MLTRVCGLSLTIAAISASVAAAQTPASEDVAVPGGRFVLARALGADTVPDRPRFLAELVRVLYEAPQSRSDETMVARLTAYIGAVGHPSDKRALKRAKELGVDVPASIESTDETVPVPLSLREWSDVVFRRPVAASELFTAVLADRRAALLSLGLAALDDETLRYVAGNPSLLRRLYEEHAASFAAFGEALRIRDGRLVSPGGAQGLAVWEAILDAKAAAPDRFVPALLGAAHGRVALVYAALTHLDAPHVRFALGSWMPDPQARLERFKMVIAASVQHTEWEVERWPFARPANDTTLMLTRVRVELDGRPAAPASRLFWRRVFDGIDAPDDPARLLRNGREDGVIDAGWLADNICVQDLRVRAERLDQLSFGQRVFGSVEEGALPDALVAVRTLPRFRMLMLTLERMGIRSPRVFSAAARHAEQLTSLSGRRAFVAFGQVQGALAVLARLERVHRLPRPAIEALTVSLLATPFADGAEGGGVARWLSRDVRTALNASADADVDEVLVRALAGIEAPADTLPRVA